MKTNGRAENTMIGVKKFKKCKEDFICENCGKLIIGNGYTNHCPYCLWSKHVDVNPGDRAAACRGMMKPIRIETSGKEMVIILRCVECGYEKRNKTQNNDDLSSWLSGKSNLKI